MNTGQAYFSQNAYLNHSAVNPLFSLFESITHQEDFASQYRFMKDKEADKIFATMTSTSDENTYLLNEATFKKGTPDILIVIMESFASDIMPSMAHTRMLQYAWIPSPSRVFYLQDSMPTVSVRTEAWFPY
mgnify:CR=1 FL=1